MDDSVQSGTFIAASFYGRRSVPADWCPPIGGVEPRNTWAGPGTHPLGEQTVQPSWVMYEILIVCIVVAKPASTLATRLGLTTCVGMLLRVPGVNSHDGAHNLLNRQLQERPA